MTTMQGINTDGEDVSSFYVIHNPVNAPHADDGMTRQEFAEECDINVLMATYERNGVLNHFNRLPPQYLDVTEVPDLQNALAIYNQAEQAFMTLPAKVRKEFDNDPVKFVEFAQDRENLPAMQEWGLAPPTKLADAIPTPTAAIQPGKEETP